MIEFSYEGIADIAVAFVRLDRVLIQRVGTECEWNMSPTQVHTLLILHKLGPISMSGMCKYMVIQKQQMTKLISALVRKGYVKRHTDPDNRRVILVQVTPSGCGAIHKILDEHITLLNRLLEILPPEEKERFLAGVQSITDVISNIKV